MRISEHKLSRLMVVAFILVFSAAGNTFATTTQDPQMRSIPDGESVKKFRGIVVKRDPDSFTMSDTTGGGQTSKRTSGTNGPREQTSASASARR